MRNKIRDLELTAHARLVLEKRYLRRNKEGLVIESPRELFERTAKSLSEGEFKDRQKWCDSFYEMMISKRFLPNSPTLINAGKKGGQLSACFVLPIGDSLESIFDALKFAAKIHQSGGGTGFSFSRLRPKGSLVRSTSGVASGPVSFMRIFDVATETVKQGGVRRGANMAVLRVDHPDIQEFIECKTNFKTITNFNISVGITREFMEAVRLGKEFWLRDPQTWRNERTINAKQLFDQIVRSSWMCGDPGLIFLDRMNFLNPTPHVGSLESTNPCGEQPLLPFESCNLGSLNVGLYFKNKKFNWKLFRNDIWTAVRFLDNVIDINSYPIPECGKITLRNRKIGLGIMGFADLLLKEGLPYSSLEAVRRGEQLMSFLDREAKRASAALAAERGPFPNWKGSLWQELGYPPLRNATVSTVAPTGTISIIAGASSGIEPLFSGVFKRNILDGEQLTEVHPVVQEIMKEKGLDVGSFSNRDSLTDDEISASLGEIWTPSFRVPVEGHVKMQAAFQRHSDSAVSKTINLPKEASEEDVAVAFWKAYEWGCKGITIYRDQSRPSQVLERASSEGGTSEDASELADVLNEECPRCTPA